MKTYTLDINNYMNRLSKYVPKIIPTHTSGIYKITNVKTNQHYIGLSSKCRERLLRHLQLLEKKQHINQYLQNSYNKYGKENFTFELVEKCNEIELYSKEILYTEKYNSMYPNGFNLCKPGRYRQRGEYEGFRFSNRCIPFQVISPDEKEYTVNVCSVFIKEHPSITAGQLRSLKRGSVLYSKSGWRLKNTPKEKPPIVNEDLYIIDPNNTLHHVTNVKHFEKEYNLSRGTIMNLKTKLYTQYNGWYIDWSKTDPSKFKCIQFTKETRSKYWNRYKKS